MKRAVNQFVPILALISACAIGGDDSDPAFEQALSGTASVELSSAAANVTLTSGSQWSLTKTGSLSGNSVTWNVTAAKSATVSNQLVVQGHLKVKNNGSGPATIGNVVVNLQTRVNNQWKSASVDVADATNGDAATTAKIHAQASSENKSSFTENTASGALKFMDAASNSVFSLSPQLVLGAGQTRTVRFQATFNNDVLHLIKGTEIRSEVIVSFGNATVNGNSTANVDINGNGTIDADEHHVRSVPSRLGLTVPKATQVSSTATLTDTLADIAATGTVTFSSVWFNLGPTGGTVTAVVDGGRDGGTITNCAHLSTQDTVVSCGGYNYTQSGGTHLDACSTIDVGGTPTCTPGTAGCGWHDGDLTTHSQFGYDTTTSWFAAYDTTYASTFGVVEVGIPGTSGYSMRFSSANNIANYFIDTGTLGPLTSDMNDPTSTSSGTFGSEMLTLRLNVDFSANGSNAGTSTTKLGNLTLCAMTDTSLNGSTVNDVLALGNTLLGGGSNGYTISDITALIELINPAFDNGSPSTFAQDHLFVGACP